MRLTRERGALIYVDIVLSYVLELIVCIVRVLCYVETLSSSLAAA
jgi:hypothetical protein